MTTKADIIEHIGEPELLLPELVSRGLAANDRLKYYLTLLQVALAHAENPHAVISNLRSEREACGVDDRALDDVVVQAMVFGNSGVGSGSGVGFTRNPDSGENALLLDFLSNAQGEDIVSGRDPVRSAGDLRELLPQGWEGLRAAKSALEREFLDMQDFEFTIEDGHLHVLAAAREATLGTRRLREGDRVTLDGESGLIYAGEVPVVATKPVDALTEIARWRQAAVA